MSRRQEFVSLCAEAGIADDQADACWGEAVHGDPSLMLSLLLDLAEVGCAQRASRRVVASRLAVVAGLRLLAKS